jgi:hypothetical protein
MANKAIFLLQETHSEKSEDSYHYIWGTKDFILNHGEITAEERPSCFLTLGTSKLSIFQII